jgi:YD repeat-containing protein
MVKIITPVLLFLNLFLINGAFGQPSDKRDLSDYARLSEVLPPSPGAASLGKFGGINFGLSSGAMNHTIPLANFHSSNVEVPISISYNTTGFKVDELATRVGTSWNLNAGGVITRIVRGAVDERCRRLVPPADFPQRTRNLVDFMEGIVNSNENGPADAEHDVFSFNFLDYSGRFILDENKNPVLLAHSAIKIEQDFFSVDCNFLFTAPDGVKYYFGGKGATETTRKSAVGGGCGKPFRDQIPTAWYLNKIIHPNQDTVYFKYIETQYEYKAGISQSSFSSPLNATVACANGASVGCGQMQNTTCVSRYLINGVLLKEVISRSGGRIRFLFTNRKDGLDSLVSSIEIYKPQGNQIFKTFDLIYFNAVAIKFSNSFSVDQDLVNRPFLVKLIERAPANAFNSIYEFSYEELNDLPPRLSFAQDHYGYFNGKGNSSLIPLPPDQSWHPYFRDAKANREADPVFSRKGLLTKIKYPTGGEDVITYEGHTIYQKVITMLPDTMVELYGQGSGNITRTFSSDVIPLKNRAGAKLKGSFSYDEIIGGEFDSRHHFATINLIEVNTGRIVYQKAVTRKEPDFDYYLVESFGDVRITITIRGTGSFAGAQLVYKPSKPVITFQDVYVGGIRVAKVITKDNVQGNETVKKYAYRSLEHPEKSSGAVVNKPIYDHLFSKVTSCTTGPSDYDDGYWGCTVGGCSYYSMYSSAQNNIFIYPGSPVYYHTVIESFGQDFENGGKEYHFLVEDDIPGKSIIGQDIVGAPYSDFSWNNGKETLQYSFKKEGSALIPVQKVFTSYRMDPRRDKELTSYIASKRYTPECTGVDPPNVTEMNAYYLMSYSHFQKWVYVDTVKTLTYDSQGLNFITQVDVTEYDNPNHAFATRQITIGSDGKEVMVKNFYPQDLVLSGEEEDARQALIAKNILSPSLEQQIVKAGNPISKSKASFSVFPNGLVLPRSYFTQMGNGPLEKRVEFLSYNNKGKLLQQAKEADVKQSYIYDYGESLPIAQVVNASLNEIAYSSFEADGKGNWEFAGSSRPDVSSPTGNRCYSLASGELSKTGLTPSKVYKVSYWLKGPSAAYIPNSLTIIQGATKNGWTFFEHSFTGQYTVIISGIDDIDEVRLYPEETNMITYTYDPIIGITSATDENNVSTYYQYDAFGRLSLMKDDKGNILKKYDYMYAGQETAISTN